MSTRKVNRTFTITVVADGTHFSTERFYANLSEWLEHELIAPVVSGREVHLTCPDIDENGLLIDRVTP